MIKKYLVCPRCGDRRLFLKNANDQRIGVYITHEHEIIPMNPENSIEGYDTSIIYCLGCSWKGTINDLLKYYKVTRKR